MMTEITSLQEKKIILFLEFEQKVLYQSTVQRLSLLMDCTHIRLV